MNAIDDSPYRAPAAPTTPRTTHALRRTGVLYLILLTPLSLGLIVPVWFLRQRKALNAIGARLSPWPFLAVIVTIGVAVVWTVVEPNMGSRVLHWMACALMMYPCLKVKQAIESRTKGNLSGLWTVVASVYYLQYEINRMRLPPARKPALETT